MLNQRFSALLALLVALAVVSTTLACMCKPEKPSDTYCRVHWVAHARILGIAENVTIPGHEAGSERMYTIQYRQIFKTPKELNESLPTVVFSPLSESACGLELQKDHEYLLSGRFVDDMAVSTLCNQILQDSGDAAVKNDILEWNEVSTPIVEKLRTSSWDYHECDGPLYAPHQPIDETKDAAAKKHKDEAKPSASPSADAPAPTHSGKVASA